MCGILGVVSKTPVNQLLYDGLLLLQHRGQDAAGIVTSESKTFHMHKGSGYVRWSHIPNRGFLKCLSGLAKTSRLIGDNTEADRCEQFLLQLDPSHTF